MSLMCNVMRYDSVIASRYDDWYDSWWGRRFDRLEKGLLIRSLKDCNGKLILDIGCGTGHFARWFQSLGIRTIGVDISKEMLSVAKDLSSGKIPICQSRAESLPFKSNSFNLVVMITTLEFISRPNEALTEALKVCKDKVVLGMLNLWSPLVLYRKVKRVFKKSSYRGARFYSSKRLRLLIDRVTRENNIVLKSINELRSGTFIPFLSSFFVFELEKA